MEGTMFRYDKNNNLLYIQRREFPAIPNYDILKDIKDSYKSYVSEGGTIEQDVQYLVNRLNLDAKLDIPLKSKTRLGPLNSATNSYGVRPTDMFYPVYVTLYTDNGYSSPEIELLKIPYMDSRGVLNMNASFKVLVNFLSASDDVSYDSTVSPSGERKRKLNIYLGSRNLPITITDTDRCVVKIGKEKKMSLEKVIYALLASENFDKPNMTDDVLITEFKNIHNSLLTYKSTVMEGVVSKTAIDECANLDTVLINDDYAMSKTARHNFNVAMQLDRAVGHTLSRDATDDKGRVILTAGTTLTAENVALLKKNLVWRIFVKCKPVLDDMVLAYPLQLPVYEGMKAGKLVNSIVGAELHGARYVPKGVGISFDLLESGDLSKIGSEAGRYIYSTEDNKNHLNDDIAEYLYDTELTDSLSVVKTLNSVKEVVDIDLDMEIITNKTFLECDFMAGGKRDVWYTYDKNGKLVKQEDCLDRGFCTTKRTRTGIRSSTRTDGVEYYCYNGAHLNSRDFMALYSIAGWCIVSPETRILLNKDTSLLKTVQLFNEVFSAAFRKAADRYYTVIKASAGKYLHYSKLHELTSRHLAGFRHMVKEELTKGNCLKTADILNPASILADVTNISTHVMDSNSVSENQRLITLPFYGRICPYETPASSKIGLVNHKASGCMIVDGNILTAFRKVYKNGKRAYVKMDDEPVWLDPKQQLLCKVCDCLSVEIDDAGNLTSDTVLAIIPNDSTTGDATTVEAIPTYELDYISYTPEQHCSATALLMPFLGADDPARISFGLSMQKQTIFCQENQKPRVITEQYMDMFKTMPYYTVIAERDGVVDAITDSYISVRYEVVNEPNLGREEIMHTTSDGILLCGLYEGQNFNKGVEIITPIVEGLEDIEPVLAPFACTISKVDADAGTFTIREISPIGGQAPITKIPCSSATITGQSVTFTNYDKAPNEKFKKGDMLAHASIIKDGIYAPARNSLVAYMPTGYNYEDAVDMSQNCASHYTSISAHTQDTYSPSTGSIKHDFVTERSYITDGNNLGKFVPRGNTSLTDYEGVNKKEIVTVAARNVSGYVYSSYSEVDDKSKSDKRVWHTTLLSFNNEKPGDKMAGRHGNKGVDARVCKNSRMPMLRNGKIVDVCLNPCGVPSRMNLGQNLEAHLGFIAELFDIYVVSNAFNGATLDDISMLMEYAYDITNSDPATWTSITSRYGLPAGLAEHILTKVDRIKEWEGVFNKDGTAEMWDPESRRWYEYPIAFGYAYYLKLEQEVDEKIHVREGATSETYNEASQQPQQGRAHGGGQKMGEMELVTMAAYGATATLEECMNEKSDNVGARYVLTMDALGHPVNLDDKLCSPRANDNLRFLLEAMGIYTDIIGEEDKIYPIDHQTMLERPRLSGFTANSTARDAEREENNEQTKASEDQMSMADDFFGG